MQKQKRKTNHIHRAACALLAGLALSLGLLTGCGSDGSTIVVGKKNEKGYSRAEVMVIAMTEKKRYEEVCTDQIWGVSVGEKGDDFETYLKKQIRSFMDELKIMKHLGRKFEDYSKATYRPKTVSKQSASSINSNRYKKTVTVENSSNILYHVGDKVEHAAFGTGIILSIQPIGNDNLLEIEFSRVGTKKLFAKFARLER